MGYTLIEQVQQKGITLGMREILLTWLYEMVFFLKS